MAIFVPEFADWQSAFLSALSSLGGVPPKEILDDGKLHRFSVNGKKGNLSGWYAVFNDADIVGGVIGNWGTGEKLNWHWSSRMISSGEKILLADKWAEAKRKADIEHAEAQKKAIKTAQNKWDSCTEAMDDHPYLIKKQINAYGIRIGQDRLYVPLMDETGQIVSLQSIDDDGNKLFMKDGRIKGCYYLIGSPRDELLVAEGYATAASLYEATGKPVMVVFNAGNYISAIKSILIKFPNIKLTICADNDAHKHDNVGLAKGQEAAKEFRCGLVYPKFQEVNENHTDFNDFFCLNGKESVKSLFENVVKPQLKFQLLPFDSLLHFPKPKWVLDGIFTENSFGVIYGKPASGKTFVALDMALCVSHGLQWHGQDVRQGSVLYIAGEGVAGLSKRLKAWTAQNAKNEPSPPFYAITANVNFRDATDVQELNNSINSLCQQFSLIIIDTVARAMIGSEENSSTDMGLFINACDQIRTTSRAAVIGIHHSGKDDEKGMRGSTALLGAVDCVVKVSRDDNDLILLENEKQKDAEEFKEMTFRGVQIATGIYETSMIIEPAQESDVYQKTVNKKVDLYLEALQDAIISDNSTIRGLPACHVNNWRHICYNRMLGGDNQESMRQAFFRARKRLQTSKQITIDGDFVAIVSNS